MACWSICWLREGLNPGRDAVFSSHLSDPPCLGLFVSMTSKGRKLQLRSHKGKLAGLMDRVEQLAPKGHFIWHKTRARG
jgi:hypothetical protein